MKYINQKALELATVKEDPFPYITIPSLLSEEHLAMLCREFPSIKQGGSFPLNAVDCKGIFKELIEELHSNDLRQIIGQKLGMDLSQRPPVVTLRGFSRQKDGKIHTDSKSKCVTVLIYFNLVWNEKTGNLRILNSGDSLEDYREEVPSTAGTCLIFKVTENCWHGYHPFEGERQSIQLNYVVDAEAAKHQEKKHRFSAAFKALRRFLGVSS